MSEAATRGPPSEKDQTASKESKRDFHWIWEFWVRFPENLKFSKRNFQYSRQVQLCFTVVKFCGIVSQAHRTNCNLETARSFTLIFSSNVYKLLGVRATAALLVPALASSSAALLAFIFCGDLLTGHDKHSATRLYYLSSQYLSLPQQRL